MEKLVKAIETTKPYARFDKAPLYRKIDNQHLAKITANKLIRLLDDNKTLQQFAGSLGKGVLQTYDNEHELEHEIKRNEILCGLSIIRGLLQEQIIEKRFEKVLEGIDDNGEPIYATIEIGGRTLIKKVWNVYVKDIDYVMDLFTTLPIDFSDRSVPNLFKPRKRVQFFDREAGHLVTNVNRTYLKKFTRKQIPMVYKHINQLQEIEWVINRDVYEAIQANRGNYKFSDVGQQRDFEMTMAHAHDKLNKHFYFYWFLDKRGRYYCASSYLTPQGGKVAKGLLKLNRKKRLGAKGLKELYIHCANTAGRDKLPIEDRFKWTQEHLGRILMIGNDPTNTFTIWKEYDEAEVFLAACIEIAKAHQLDNPEDFESNLLIGKDATCSGIQIMSYITRDETTGSLVNLTNSELIGDVYQYVADFITWNKDWFWKDYQDKMRWLCKRPVMTRYYSAGPTTIASALMKDCKQKGIYPTQDDCDALAVEIVKICNTKLLGPSKVMKLMQSIGENLAEQNKLIYIKGLHNNFPFIQSYTLPEKSRVKFKIAGQKEIKLNYISKENGPIDINGVIKGSSPNVIHHLDSQLVSWMLSNAPYSIPTHDCWYCLAADGDQLTDDVRAGFYELFGDKDYLQQICNSLGQENTIEYGDLDTKEMLYNQYCFS